MSQSPGAVIVGGYVNGLGVIRGLAARGVPTAVVTTKPFDIAHRSRAVGSYEHAPDIEERPEQLVELLERRAGDWRGWVVIPTNDAALAALASHHDRLSSDYQVAAPPEEVARTFLDKALMDEAARAVGLDPPHRYGPASAAGVAGQELRFPVILKPRVPYRFVTRFGCKLFVAGDPTELSRGIARLEEERIAGDVTDLVPGADDRILALCTYIDGHGDPVGSLTVRKLRQNPPLYGDARVAELVPEDAALLEGSVELLRRMRHRGIAVVEYKIDRDGRPRFIEVNGRPVVYNGLLRQGGLNLGALAWSDHANGRPERPSVTGWRGAWVHLHPDVLYSALYRGHRIGPAEFVRPYRRAWVEAVWSRSDPAPFMAQWSRTAREALSAVRRRSLQARLADPTRP